MKPGKLPASRGEKLCIPFNMVLEKSATNELFETYHGVNINIQYKLNGEIKRGRLGKKISTSPAEIFLESRPDPEQQSNNQKTKVIMLIRLNLISVLCTYEQDSYVCI